MSQQENEPTQEDNVDVKARQLMQVLRQKHAVPDPQADPEQPYKVINETVLESVETPDFTGIVLHNMYYDTGINPEADTGPTETLVVCGVLGQDIVNYTKSGNRGEDLSGVAADQVADALEATLGQLNPEVQE